MQTCSVCHSQSPDNVLICPSCKADLTKLSSTAVALQSFNANPRVSKVRVSVSGDCCPVCRQAQGTYTTEEAPHLPIEGCSHAEGCRCFYEPVLETLFP